MESIIDDKTWETCSGVFCDGCGAVIPENISPFSLRDGALLCPACVRRVRIRFPRVGMEDPLKLLTLPVYQKEREETGAYRESLRERYEGADAVFIIEEVKKKGGLFSAPLWRVYGRVLYGKFYPKELALLKCRGKEKMVKLSQILPPSPTIWLKDGEERFLEKKPQGDPFDREDLGEALEGYPYELQLRERGLDLFPGDLIVKKDSWKSLGRK